MLYTYTLGQKWDWRSGGMKFEKINHMEDSKNIDFA